MPRSRSLLLCITWLSASASPGCCRLICLRQPYLVVHFHDSVTQTFAIFRVPMRLSLPIAYKSWIISLVPLLVQLCFVAVLAVLLDQVEGERKVEEHARDVASHVSGMLRLLLVSGNLGVVFELEQDGGVRPDKGKYVDIIRNETFVIEDLLRNAPEDLRRYKQVRSLYKLFKTKVARIGELLHGGDIVAAVGESRSVRACSDAMFGVADRLLLDQQAVQEEKKQAQVLNRQRVKAVLLAGVLLNIVASTSLALYFSRGIARRLRMLMDNTVRLARGDKLGPALSGDDELARLDLVFREMASLVKEMARRERAVVECAPDIICSISSAGEVSAVNPAVRLMWGYSPDDIVGRPVAQIIVSEHADGTVAMMRETAQDKSEASFENQVRHKNGSLIDMFWSTRWSAQEQALFCVARNVTARKELDRLKRGFLAMVSHDLRTPLSSLKMFLSIAGSDGYGEISSEDRRALAHAERNVEQVNALVDNVLELEKIDSGMLELNLRSSSIRSVFERALRQVSDTSRQREVKLELIDPGDGKEFTGLMDADRIARVVAILLGNAVRLSGGGSIVRLQASSDENAIKVTVTDEASRICENERERLFDRYARLTGSTQWQDPSARLGLAVCAGIVQMHGGKIGVDCNERGGSTFWFSLPVTDG